MRSPRGRLQDSVNATLYIDCRSILLADYCSHFSCLLPHYVLLPLPSSCIYRGFRATFTMKLFTQFFHTAKLTLTIYEIYEGGADAAFQAATLCLSIVLVVGYSEANPYLLVEY